MTVFDYVIEFIKTAPELAFILFVICFLISALVQTVLLMIFE